MAVLTDLEAIVMSLEVAALCLTSSKESTFTKAELYAEARSLVGPTDILRERDLDIVLPGCRFIRKAGRSLLRLH